MIFFSPEARVLSAKTSIDLNCDLGEGFGQWMLGDSDDARLMSLISSANIATGFHAGDPGLMNRSVRLAKAFGVGVGAHPGYRDLLGFGRRHIAAAAPELVNDVLYQLGALREFARRHGVPLRHLKLHGALYMHASRDEEFAHAMVEVLRCCAPELALYCMGSSLLCEVARGAGHPVVREFYADRNYDRSGSIVFARRVERPDPVRIAERVLRACLEGRVATVEGDDIEIEFESVCFHSDTPGAEAVGEAVHAVLAGAQIRVGPPLVCS